MYRKSTQSLKEATNHRPAKYLLLGHKSDLASQTNTEQRRVSHTQVIGDYQQRTFPGNILQAPHLTAYHHSKK
jgi:hypothetical protein